MVVRVTLTEEMIRGLIERRSHTSRVQLGLTVAVDGQRALFADVVRRGTLAQSEEFGSIGGLAVVCILDLRVGRQTEGDQATSEPKMTILVDADACSGVQE